MAICCKLVYQKKQKSAFSFFVNSKIQYTFKHFAVQFLNFVENLFLLNFHLDNIRRKKHAGLQLYASLMENCLFYRCLARIFIFVDFEDWTWHVLWYVSMQIALHSFLSWCLAAAATAIDSLYMFCNGGFVWGCCRCRSLSMAAICFCVL